MFVSSGFCGATLILDLGDRLDTDRFRGHIEATAKTKGISREAAFEERIGGVPARRAGDPNELGAACAFLCSAHAGYITGQNLLMDGGVFPGAF